MGSLLAGWDSFHDPKKVQLERSKSLTKEGIEAYWKSRKKVENEDQVVKMKSTKEPEKKYQRSSSMVLTNTKGSLINLDNDVNLEKLIQEKGWWTRSNSAFLNEPPVIASDGFAYKYASQFHVSDLGSPPEHNKGI